MSRAGELFKNRPLAPCPRCGRRPSAGQRDCKECGRLYLAAYRAVRLEYVARMNARKRAFVRLAAMHPRVFKRLVAEELEKP